MLRFGAAAIINDTHGGFLLRTLAISAIVIALAMRYLYISSEWRRSIVLEAQARVSALQALIRPHFLFNSMNTIASLTRSNPQWGCCVGPACRWTGWSGPMLRPGSIPCTRQRTWRPMPSRTNSRVL